MDDFLKVVLTLLFLCWVWDMIMGAQYPAPGDWKGPKQKRFRLRTLQWEWGAIHEWKDHGRRTFHRRWVWERDLTNH